MTPPHRRPARRLAWMAVVGLVAGPSVAAPPGAAAGAEEPVPVPGIAAHGGTWLDESFEAYDALAKLDALTAAAAAHGGGEDAAPQWSEAVDAALAVCERYGDKLCRTGGDDRLFITVRAAVLSRIANGPAAGRSAYARRAEARAAARVAAATAERDGDELLRIAEETWPTTAAADAVERAVAIALESGEAATAVRWLDGLLADHPERPQRQAHWERLRDAAVSVSRSPFPHPPSEVTLAHDASRRNSAPGRPRAEAALWRFDLPAENTLLEPGGGHPLTEPSSANARALSAGRLCAIEPIVADGRIYLHDHRTVWCVAPGSERGTRHAEPDPTSTGDRSAPPTPTSAFPRPLPPLWTFALAPPPDGSPPWQSEDEPPPQFTSTLSAGRLYIPLERRPPDRFGADPAHPPGSVLACLDAADGRPLWLADLAGWAAEFEEARLDGAPLVVGDRAVAIARRRKPFGFEACYLVGFALDDGRMLFATHVGEAATGGLGYRRATVSHPSASGERVFVQTNLGTVAAVSAASGRVCWLRVYEPTPTGGERGGRGGPQARAWQYAPTMVWRERVIAAPLDLDRVLIIDQADGRLSAELALAELRHPETLIGIDGDRLYAVGAAVVCYDLSAGRIVWERPLADGELFGRAALSSDSVFVPTTAGLLRYPLDGGAAEMFAWAAASAGNVVVADAIAPGAWGPRAGDLAAGCRPGSPPSTRTPAGSWPDQVVIGASLGVFGLSGRAAAFACLEAAMQARPDDPEPALAVADLALTTRDPGRGRAALDEAIRRAGGAANLRDDGLRRRLLTGCLAHADAGRDAPDERDEMALLERAGQLALDPAEQVAYRSRLADAHARRGRIADAAGVWQQILSDPGLRAMELEAAIDPAASDPGGTGFQPVAVADRPAASDPVASDPVASDLRVGRPPATAGDLARRAIDRLIAAHGRAVYAEIEREAMLRFDAARRAGDATALRRIAHAFPNSRVAPQARLAAAGLLRAAGRPDEAAAALRSALEGPGDFDRPQTARRLVECLLQADRRDAAGAWLRRAARRYPDYRFDEDGRRMTFDEWRVALGVADEGSLRPSPGTYFRRAWTHEFGEPPVVLYPPGGRAPRAAWDGCLTYCNGKIEARRVSDGTAVWPAPVDCRLPPTLLGCDDRRVVLVTRHQILALDRASGEAVWTLGEYPPEADAPEVDPEWIAAWTCVAATDDRVYGALDRGELVCVDRSNGTVRWRVPTVQKVASDLVAHGDVLAYVAREERSNRIVFVNARDGRSAGKVDIPDERALQRLLFAPGGDLLAVSARHLFAIDPRRREVRWVATSKARLLTRTLQVNEDGVFAGTEDGRIVAFDLETGRVAWARTLALADGDDPLWTDCADGILYAAGFQVVEAIDTFDGTQVWMATGHGVSDGPADVGPPVLTADGLMMVGRGSLTTAPGEVAGKRDPGRREPYVAQFYPRATTHPADKDAPYATFPLGRIANPRGVLPYNGGLLVIDGRTLIGYSAAVRP